MKINFLISTIIALAATPLLAEVDHSIFDQNGKFVECTLDDGRRLLANDYWVAVGDVILSKNLVATSDSGAADWAHYQGSDYDVNIYKQYCARGGVQGVEIIHVSGDGPLGTTAPGTVQVISCQERDQCIDDDFML